MTSKQKEALAKYYLQVSLLSLGTLVFTYIIQAQLDVKITLAVYGLTISIVFLILGIYLLKE